MIPQSLLHPRITYALDAHAPVLTLYRRMMPDTLRQQALTEPPIHLTLIPCSPPSNERRLDTLWVRSFVPLRVYVCMCVMVAVGMTLLRGVAVTASASAPAPESPSLSPARSSFERGVSDRYCEPNQDHFWSFIGAGGAPLPAPDSTAPPQLGRPNSALSMLQMPAQRADGPPLKKKRYFKNLFLPWIFNDGID